MGYPGSMSGKQGAWIKPGSTSGNAQAPGSYGDYVYMRAPPKDYDKTDQQAAVGDAGRAIAEECEGKEGSDFRQCRSEVLDSQF